MTQRFLAGSDEEFGMLLSHYDITFKIRIEQMSEQTRIHPSKYRATLVAKLPEAILL